METRTFHATGLRCGSCALLVEAELCGCDGVRAVRVDVAAQTVVVEGEFPEGDTVEAAAERYSAALGAHGYALAAAPRGPLAAAPRWGDFRIAAPIALAALLAFVGLQKTGIVQFAGDDVSYGAAFVLGLVASVSTCAAVVGSLLLSVSATYARRGERVRPQVAFHVSRLVAFFALGGAIGALGSAFALSPGAEVALGIALGLVMLGLGLRLLGVFPWAERLQLITPRALSRGAVGAARRGGWLAPAALGVATFFLPCGFTQSMQLYALSTGSFWGGALSMLAFALGTLPALALLSASPVGSPESRRGSVFFKVAGLVVIAFAFLNVAGSLVAAGVLPPFFSF